MGKLEFSKNAETTDEATEAVDAAVETSDVINDSTETKDTDKDTSDVPAVSDAERLELIREIIANSDISNTEKWEALTPVERMEMLCDLSKEIAKVMGVDNTKIVFRNDMSRYVYGSYNRISGEVQINRVLVNDAGQRLNALDTLCHEYRHAFQYAAIQNPEKYGISQELADEWQSNLPPYGVYLSAAYYGMEAYCKQPVERDAFEWEEKCRGDMK